MCYPEHYYAFIYQLIGMPQDRQAGLITGKNIHSAPIIIVHSARLAISPFYLAGRDILVEILYGTI